MGLSKLGAGLAIMTAGVIVSGLEKAGCREKFLVPSAKIVNCVTIGVNVFVNSSFTSGVSIEVALLSNDSSVSFIPLYDQLDMFPSIATALIL